MKADLDRLMEEYKLDAIVVLGGEAPNTYRDYLTNRAKAGGTVFKKRGEEAIFITGGMEVDEAAKSGLKVYTFHDFGMEEIAKKYAGQANAQELILRELYQTIFQKLGVTGRVAFYGTVDLSATLPLVLALHDGVPNLDIVIGGESSNLFSRAYETKDQHELEALQKSARLTCQVVRDTWNFISHHYATGEAVGSPIVDEHGKQLTVGDVKRYIRLRQAELGLQDGDSRGCIFAQGRDAALPHSTGEDNDVLQVGKTIVFDIFPTDQESGYYHDMTRTWCLGQAPAEVQAAYDDVMKVFHDTNAAFKVGEATSTYQVMALDYFESKGHPTHRSHPGTFDGYVHSLGHGLGLNIHEAPGVSERSRAKLAPGNAFTVEPGLYYPDRGFGIRVEDTVYFDENGTLHRLTDFPYDLVLPLKVVHPTGA